MNASMTTQRPSLLSDVFAATRFDCSDRITLADGRSVVLCPLLPQDASAEQAFVRSLSPTSRYRRFHNGMRELPPSLLAQLTRIDQTQHVAIVARAPALDDADAASIIVADARYVIDDNGWRAEFAIAVSDGWQRSGLGREMMTRLADHARERGVTRLVGDVLVDNVPMLRMVRALGGTVTATVRSASVMQARFELEAMEALRSAM